MLVDSVGQAIATEVPLRLSAAELRVMALRQQQQIDSQHKLLTAKEQRLRFLKTQESPNFISNGEEEKLRRLRDRVEAQENKLRQLRALRGQVDLQKTYNVTLNNDLNSIRALFSEKEKELSLAVAKVDALTKQLEELRQDRRGPLNGISTNLGQQISLTSMRELEKLRRELMYRNQISLQQDARLHFQRAALQQKQAELKSVDQRIFELQIRLQKRKASNLVQINSANNNFEQYTQQQQQSQEIPPNPRDNENNKATLKIRPSNNVYPGQRVIPRNNIAAVEPFIHTPQSGSSENEKPKGGMDTSAISVENPFIQNLKQMKQSTVPINTILGNIESITTDSDESKLAQQKLAANMPQPKDAVLNIANKNGKQPKSEKNECDTEKFMKYFTSSESAANKENDKTAQSVDALKKSIMTSNFKAMQSANSSTFGSSDATSSAIKYKSMIPSGNSVVPPRKPVSSVAPSMLQPPSTVKKPKINMVAPSVQANSNEEVRPALPPKPSRPIPSSTDNNSNPNTQKNSSNKTPSFDVVDLAQSGLSNPSGGDSQPIKAKPLTIKKQPLCEQPKLKSTNMGAKAMQNISRRKEMGQLNLMSSVNMEPLLNNQKTSEEETNQPTNFHNFEKSLDESKRRNKQIVLDQRKIKLSRRVSFDPLALLLDASLEGELELVKKTAIQVANPSAANDEGITALHNAICAGHFEIVKFLVELGCDVNAQDSDGWTPLHCAASCNNLTMVKFLVESGACLFASTLSDHETPAEKCEEDEEGFDGCSEYLYSIQEKLGILNNGEVYAVFSYDAQQVDELSFKINDRLVILRKGDDAEREWWWAKNENNAEGYVPRNLLGLYPRIAMTTSHMPD